MKVINSFRGNYAFLSNFFSGAPFEDCNGQVWKTSEHYYQAMKSTDFVIRESIRECKTAGEAKILGSPENLDIRLDWNNVNVGIMTIALKMKFDQNSKYKKYLLQTEGYKLVEGNWWHDNFWGDCYCDKCENIKGQNMLGKLLMRLRDNYIMESIL